MIAYNEVESETHMNKMVKLLRAKLAIFRQVCVVMRMILNYIWQQNGRKPDWNGQHMCM